MKSRKYKKCPNNTYALKVLRRGGRSPFTGYFYPLPKGNGLPGKWAKTKGPLRWCKNGIHAATFYSSQYWLTLDDYRNEYELWVIELYGDVRLYENKSPLQDNSKYIARAGRLIRKVDMSELLPPAEGQDPSIICVLRAGSYNKSKPKL